MGRYADGRRLLFSCYVFTFSEGTIVRWEMQFGISVVISVFCLPHLPFSHGTALSSMSRHASFFDSYSLKNWKHLYSVGVIPTLFWTLPLFFFLLSCKSAFLFPVFFTDSHRCWFYLPSLAFQRSCNILGRRIQRFELTLRNDLAKTPHSRLELKTDSQLTPRSDGRSLPLAHEGQWRSIERGGSGFLFLRPLFLC